MPVYFAAETLQGSKFVVVLVVVVVVAVAVVVVLVLTVGRLQKHYSR